ncbi:MAG TPA: hypothetical protein VK154_03785 [Chitinophagales bacterium]|nr:hypothetical protein [Chitinophagales bacterium]
MYCLTEQQIDRILNDIRARGVKTESLQLNLLDHICCIVERDLEPEGDFESFYQRTLKTFYKHELREIEEEALILLTYKNYYAMKKTMIVSGGISAFLLSTGIFFKFQHWPGAAICIVSGISIFSLLFLPLLFLLKAKENSAVRDRVIYGLGTFAAILFSLAVMFKIFYWPGANIMGVSVIVLMAGVFLPIYFFSGIRNAETKLNTIVSSVLIVAGCGLFLSLIRTPAKTHQQQVADTRIFVRNQQILETEQRQLKRDAVALSGDGAAINGLCESLKAYILEKETGKPAIPYDFNSETTMLSETWANVYFDEGTKPSKDLFELRSKVKAYNEGISKQSDFQGIAVEGTVLASEQIRVAAMLNDLIQIQMVVVQNEREQLVAKK